MVSLARGDPGRRQRRSRTSRWSGTAYPLFAVTRLGRGSDTDIRIEDPGASRHHCEIVLGHRVTVRDLSSTNGTFVNGGDRAAGARDGHRIMIGSTHLVFRSG